MQTMSLTHETYIRRVADIAMSRLSSADHAALDNIKLTYGAGPDNTRGVTYYRVWQNGKCGPQEHVPFVTINALHQSSLVQLAGTTLHELGHALAGFEAGHGKDWHNACEKLGLRRIKAAGTNYVWSMFDRDIREFIAALPKPYDGAPAANFGLPMQKIGRGKSLAPKSCTAGIGTRGGTSRGVGSGSRLRLWQCQCDRPVKVRVASDSFAAHHDVCGQSFYAVKV